METCRRESFRAGASIFVLVLTSVLLGTAPAPCAEKPGALRVLILSGANNHEWRQSTPVLKRILDESPRFAVAEVIEDPSKCDAATFRRCDVVLSNWSAFPAMTGRQWGKAAEEAFLDFLRGGGGFVVVHAASATCQDWPEFQDLVALTWGIDRTGHGAYHTFPVFVEDREHPITRGLGDFWITDELWHNMASFSKEKPRVLCTAFSAAEQGGTGKREPALVATSLGKGRGLNLVLGHDAAAMENVGWQTLLLRGTEWAATGAVTIPAPEVWPATASTANVRRIDSDAALAEALRYRDGQSRRALSIVEELVRYVLAADAAEGKAPPGDRTRKLAGKIAACLSTASISTPEKGAAAEAKAFLLRQLSTIATEAEVPAVAAWLSDPDLSYPARYALERIPGPAPDAALRDALAKVGGALKVGVINSLGDRRSAAAARDLIPLLADADPGVAEAAASALGKIGGEDAARALGAALAGATGSQRRRIAEAWLMCADGFAAADARACALEICERLYAPGEAAATREAALRGLAAWGGDRGVSLVLDALMGDDAGLRGMAVTLIRDVLGDARSLAKLRERLETPGAKDREAVLRALGSWPAAAPLGDLLGTAPSFEWRKADDSLALFTGGLLTGGRAVWQLNFPRGGMKSCFHPVALPDGTQITWLSPPDHCWHRALWFAWTELNGVSYWEEDKATGLSKGLSDVTDAKVTPAADFSAKIELSISYHLAGQPPVLTEKRDLAVGAPDAAGRYVMDWKSTFVAGPADVFMKGGTAGGGYAGLSVRIAQSTREWKLIDSEGREDGASGGLAKNTHGQRSRWMDCSFNDAATGRPAGIAILDHPENLRFPSEWHVVMDEKGPFGYFSPAPLWSAPYTLPAGKALVLRYRIVVHPGRGERLDLEREWGRFRRETP